MTALTIEKAILDKLENLSLGLIYAEVQNSGHNSELWEEIERESKNIQSAYELDRVKVQQEIHATREAYKKLGKDPNRYRPSAEALYRRILKGSPLYRVSTLVDIINLVSLKTGFSIGGFDADKIVSSLSLGIGMAGEPFEAIGRGDLNIENLPVFRDRKSAIGTPTSDSVRTSIGPATSKILLVINNFSADRGNLDLAIKLTASLVLKYGMGENLEMEVIPGDFH